MFKLMCAQGVVSNNASYTEFSWSNYSYWVDTEHVFNKVIENVFILSNGSAPESYRDVCPVRLPSV